MPPITCATLYGTRSWRGIVYRPTDRSTPLVEVTARDLPDSVGHRQPGQAESEGHPDEPIPMFGNAAARTAAPHPPKTNQNVPTSSAVNRLVSGRTGMTDSFS